VSSKCEWFAVGARGADLFTDILTGNWGFEIGFSVISGLSLLLISVPRSVDNDILTGGDGDLGFPCLASFSSAIRGIF